MADLHDEVKHISNEASGVVIAQYTIDNTTYLDVRIDDHIYYRTPEANWTVTVAADE